jgi:hypothetical protein
MGAKNTGSVHNQIDVQDAAPQKTEVKLTLAGHRPGPCGVAVSAAQQWLNGLMTISPPVDSVLVEEP